MVWKTLLKHTSDSKRGRPSVRCTWLSINKRYVLACNIYEDGCRDISRMVFVTEHRRVYRIGENWLEKWRGVTNMKGRYVTDSDGQQGIH